MIENTSYWNGNQICHSDLNHTTMRNQQYMYSYAIQQNVHYNNNNSNHHHQHLNSYTDTHNTSHDRHFSSSLNQTLPKIELVSNYEQSCLAAVAVAAAANSANDPSQSCYYNSNIYNVQMHDDYAFRQESTPPSQYYQYSHTNNFKVNKIYFIGHLKKSFLRMLFSKLFTKQRFLNGNRSTRFERGFISQTVNTHLKVHYDLVQHATLRSEFGPIKGMLLYLRQPLGHL